MSAIYVPQLRMKMNQFPINKTVYTPNWNVWFWGGAFDLPIQC